MIVKPKYLDSPANKKKIEEKRKDRDHKPKKSKEVL